MEETLARFEKQERDIGLPEDYLRSKRELGEAMEQAFQKLSPEEKDGYRKTAEEATDRELGKKEEE